MGSKDANEGHGSPATTAWDPLTSLSRRPGSELKFWRPYAMTGGPNGKAEYENLQQRQQLRTVRKLIMDMYRAVPSPISQQAFLKTRFGLSRSIHR